MKFFKLPSGRYVNFDKVAYISIDEKELKICFCFSAMENEITNDCVEESFELEDDFNEFVEFLNKLSSF